MFPKVFSAFLVFVTCIEGFEYFEKQPKDSSKGGRGFSFASYYGDNMVLQAIPYRATIWGHAPNGSHYGLVNVVIYPKLFTYVATVNDDLTWSLSVGPFPSGGPVSIEATLGNQSVRINNVMYGDVWVCSGQSNMQFSMIQVFNASAELADSVNYPNIRIFELNLKTSNEQLSDLTDDGVMVPWSLPTPGNLGGKPFTHFSAVCWLYGKYLYQKLQKPIGLIDTSWGGTPVEAWSSEDALKKCGLSKEEPLSVQDTLFFEKKFGGPQQYTEIWNAMVYPLLKMTIYGAIWYQGENNAHLNKHLYNCTFPTMIDDWRKKFHDSGESSQLFPFGFVQLSGLDPSYTEDTGFAEIRWHQTADYGYVPNHRQRNVFMAVAMDLPDFTSPYGNIHPRDKQDVAARLALGGLAIGYGYNISYQGPYPVKVAIYKEEIYNYTQVEIEYTMDLDQRWFDSFEVCCSIDKPGVCLPGKSWWLPTTTVQAYDRENVTLSYAAECDVHNVVGVRYAWRDSPCPFKKCAIYGADNNLPLPPFRYYGKEFQKIQVDEHRYIVKIL